VPPTHLGEFEGDGLSIQVLVCEVQRLSTGHTVCIAEAKGMPVDEQLDLLGACAILGTLDANVMDADLLVDCTTAAHTGENTRRTLGWASPRAVFL